MSYQKTTERFCGNCGKAELRPPKGKVHFFCSRECRLQHRRKKWKIAHPHILRILSCQLCGTEFEPKPTVWHKTRYCSYRCKKKGYRQRITEFHKRNPKKGAEYHRKIRKRNKWHGNWYKALERDNFTCRFCGKIGKANTLAKRTLLVHHLDGEGETGLNHHELENLMTICYDCHDGIHGISLVSVKGQWYFQGKILKRFDTNKIGVLKE